MHKEQAQYEHDLRSTGKLVLLLPTDFSVPGMIVPRDAQKVLYTADLSAFTRHVCMYVLLYV